MFFLTHSFETIIFDVDTLSSEELLALIKSLRAKLNGVEKVVFFDSVPNFEEAIKILDSDLSHEEKDKFIFCNDKDFLFESSSVMLNKAVQKFGPLPFRTLYFTQSSESIEVASRFPFGTILVKEKISVQDIKSAPDLCLNSWNDVSKVIEGTFLGHLGEVNVASNRIFPKYKAPAYGHMTKIVNEKLEECPLYVGGRYFVSSDLRSHRHIYTARLVNSKSKPSLQAPNFSHVVDGLLNFIVQENSLKEFLICKVPSRPSNTYDRLGQLLARVDSAKWKIDNVLHCARDYAPQKSVKGIANKEKNVSGAYKVDTSYDVSGKDVIVIDDIATTFSTVNECARTLLKNGARRVFLLSLAVTVHDFDLFNLRDIKCSDCDHNRVLRFNHKDGGAFWGCANPIQFKTGGFHSPLSLEVGFNKLKKIDLEETDENIQF